MDLNDIRIAITLLSFAIFIGLVRWAWSKRRRSSFDEAAQLPFSGEESPR
jgi:cytochrome c oxidase cbb3-type subunit 4